MLTSKQVSILRNRIELGVKKLGAYKGNLPDTNDPREEAAGKLFLWSEITRHAKAGLEAAQAEAVLVGAIVDKTKSTLTPGNHSLFEGEHMSVMCTVKNGAKRVSMKDFILALVKRNVSKKIIDDATKDAEKRDANAYTFIALPRMSSSEPVNSQPHTPAGSGK